VDLAASGTWVYAVVAPYGQSPTLQVLDAKTATWSTLAPNGYGYASGLTTTGPELASLEGLAVKRRSLELAQSLGPTPIWLQPSAPLAVTPTGASLRHLAFTRGQFITWAGTRVGVGGLEIELVLLNAVNTVQSPEAGRLHLALGASHVTGLEAFGDRLWVAATGAASSSNEVAPPKIVEVLLD